MEGLQQSQTGRQVSKNLYQKPDGTYLWAYELNLFKDLSVFWLIWRIFFFVILGIFLFMMILNIFEDSSYFMDGFLETLKVFGFFVLGMTAIVVISYLIYAAVMGGKYCVVFEMNEKGVLHKQMPKQAKKAETLAMITALIGLASDNVTTAGTGMMSARTEMYSEFSRVRSIQANARRCRIKVNETPGHNQVYAAKEDFEFIRNYIVSHCPNAKVKG